MSALAYDVPSPPIQPELAAFWAAAQQRQLLLPRCDDCRRYHYYPRAHCPHCLGTRLTHHASPGRGEIYSVSVMRRGVAAPYAIAYVTLDEGITMLTHVVADDLDALRIGQRVSLIFQPSAGGQLVPMFRPDPAQAPPR